MSTIGRRELLLSLPGMALASRVIGQGSKPIIPVKTLNHFELSVSDVKRSVEFYQGLFGMPIQARQGSTVILRIGDGPQFIALSPAGAEPPRIVPRVGFTVEDFNADQIVGVLAKHGVTPAAAADPGLTGGPLKVRVSKRGPESGGAAEGTTELFFGDPDGVVLQVQDKSYAGGGGALGNEVNLEPSPAKGLLALKDMSHFTIAVSDGNRAQTFYKDLFGMPVRSMQATTPGLGVGPGVMFLMFIGGGGGRGARGGAAAGAAPAPPRASVNHVSINMENFNPNAVLKTLAEFGITERGPGGGAAGPLKSYITLRMPDRGGAPGGTPELYFTDPDGLLLQLQDVTYCGGGGFLGNVCMG